MEPHRKYLRGFLGWSLGRFGFSSLSSTLVSLRFSVAAGCALRVARCAKTLQKKQRHGKIVKIGGGGGGGGGDARFKAQLPITQPRFLAIQLYNAPQVFVVWVFFRTVALSLGGLFFFFLGNYTGRGPMLVESIINFWS